METYESILEHWFGELPPKKEKFPFWFGKARNFCELTKSKFEGLLIDALGGKLDEWQKNERSYLSLIILLDQFSRLIYFGTDKAYQQDSLALRLTLKGIERGIDSGLQVYERVFFYMPMQHQENLQFQKKHVDYISYLIKHTPDELEEFIDEALLSAITAKEIIEKFGRFPDRNSVLKRESTPQELEFLSNDESLFYS